MYFCIFSRMSTATIELSSTRQKLFESLGDSQAAYIDHMKQWFRKKSTKEEFDLAARKLLSKDVIYLHNQFLLAILNKCQTLVNINPGPSLVKSELGSLSITQELLSPSKFDPSADRLKKGKIKRKVKPNKPQLEHKFQPVATSLCAPEVTPVNLAKEEKEVKSSLTFFHTEKILISNFSCNSVPGRRLCRTFPLFTAACWSPPGRRGSRGWRTPRCP